MQLFPKTPGQWIRFGLVFAILLGGVMWFRLDRVAGVMLFYGKEEGDLLFQSLPRMEGASDLVDAIEGVTQSPWSHCGILLKKEGKWIVAESIGEVRETPLLTWVLRGRGRVCHAYRVKEFRPESLPALKEAIHSLLGLSYDYRYAPDLDEIYCSELIEVAFAKATGLKLGKWEALGTLNWKPHEAFIRDMESGELPLERLMVTPVSLTRDAQMALVWP